MERLILVTFKRKQTLSVSKEYTPAERQAISLDVVDFIRKRTAKGKDKDNNPFKKYSDAYIKSDEFKIAGKNKNKVNLKLSGDMMSELDVLPSKNGEVAYGYEKGSQELGKVEGNTIDHGRDFFGIAKQDFKRIMARYPIKNREVSKGRAGLINILQDLSANEAREQALAMAAAGKVQIDVARELYREQYGKDLE